MTEGPLIDLSVAQPMRSQYSGHVTSVDQSEGAKPETDAERLAKLKVRRSLARRIRRREQNFCWFLPDTITSFVLSPLHISSDVFNKEGFVKIFMIQAIRETLRQAQHQMSAKPGHQGAAAQTKSKGESYR